MIGQLLIDACSDIHYLNIMMDPRPLTSEMYHPFNKHKSYDFRRKVRWKSRTATPTKYYYIDFGISTQYSADDTNPLAFGTVAGDKSIPEFQNSVGPYNPFHIDIYCLGNVIRQEFTEVRRFRA